MLTTTADVATTARAATPITGSMFSPVPTWLLDVLFPPVEDALLPVDAVEVVELGDSELAVELLSLPPSLAESVTLSSLIVSFALGAYLPVLI